MRYTGKWFMVSVNAESITALYGPTPCYEPKPAKLLWF